jgi:hypothetical protein
MDPPASNTIIAPALNWLIRKAEKDGCKYKAWKVMVFIPRNKFHLGFIEIPRGSFSLMI